MMHIECDLFLIAAQHYVYLKKKRSLIWQIVIAYYSNSARLTCPCGFRVDMFDSLRSMRQSRANRVTGKFASRGPHFCIFLHY